MDEQNGQQTQGALEKRTAELEDWLALVNDSVDYQGYQVNTLAKILACVLAQLDENTAEGILDSTRLNLPPSLESESEDSTEDEELFKAMVEANNEIIADIDETMRRRREQG